MDTESVHIGCGAGFASDRPDAAGPVVDTLISAGTPSYLIFETLAERTLAQAQKRNSENGIAYLPSMLNFIDPILEKCLTGGVRIVGNFGAADPMGAAQTLKKLMIQRGFPDTQIGVVLGDNLLEKADPKEIRQWTLEGTKQDPKHANVVAANVYLGAEPIERALSLGAQIVVTGRVADPALALGPLVHHYGWSWSDWDRMAAGTLVGHLLECGAQVTGGYFADPGKKDVPYIAHLGYPIAEVKQDGSMILKKAAGTGGMVTLATVKEQLLYEIHDPSAYLTPDVTLDMTGIQLSQEDIDQVSISGARGREKPDTLKATVCMDGGWMGEGEISYAGPNALKRAELAIEILKARIHKINPSAPVHFDIIGCSSVFSGSNELNVDFCNGDLIHDVRVRLATRGYDRKSVECTVAEVEALYTTGPAGGGGVRLNVFQNLDTASAFISRNLILPRVKIL